MDRRLRVGVHERLIGITEQQVNGFRSGPAARDRVELLQGKLVVGYRTGGSLERGGRSLSVHPAGRSGFADVSARALNLSQNALE